MSTVSYSKNGHEYVPQSLGLGARSSFRFLERWRISLSWLSGPFGVHDCSFGRNPFKDRGEYAGFSLDENGPHWRWRNAIVGPYLDDRQPFLGQLKILVQGNLASPDDPATLGQAKGNGDVKYLSQCSASLAASSTSASVTIINKKMHSNASEMIAGAKNIINGSNRWRLVEQPISDYSGNDYGNQPMFERWVLEIPDTDYWMIFTFYASKQFSYIERRDAFEEAHDFFRQSVASVVLEPITPLIDQEKIIRPEQCVRLHPLSPWICPLNSRSFLK